MKYLLCVVALIVAGCATLSPKATVDKYTRLAYTSTRAFQTTEEAAWHAHAPWPTGPEHQALNAKVSQVYALITAVANTGIALPPGKTLSVADLALIGNLEQVVADLLALVRGTPGGPPAVAIQQHTTQLASQVLKAGHP